MTHEDKLIQKLEHGEPGAADELIAAFYPDILRYCLWHAPDRSLAEDAAQETFLKAIRYFDRYTHQGKFKPFLYRIAANTCTDMRRKYCRPDISLEEAAIDPCYEEAAFDTIPSDMALRQLVSSLPENQREIVLLRFGQDLTLREIAEVADQPLRTVQTRLRSALKKLRLELGTAETKSRAQKKTSCDTKRVKTDRVWKEADHEE